MATSTLQKVLPPDEPASSPRLTFVEHLDELRRRLLIGLAAVVVTSSLTLWKAGWLVGWLKRPAGDRLARLAFFGPTDALAAYVQVGVLAGVVLASPILFYQAWAFVRPALTWRQRASALAVAGWGSALFVAGTALAYWMVLPWLLRFLLGVGSPYLEPVLSVNRYLSFVLGVLVTCGLVCELPLVILLLTRAGIVSPELLRRARPVAWLILVIAAAVITPTTDAVTMILATIPLIALYELSIAVSRLSRTR